MGHGISSCIVRKTFRAEYGEVRYARFYSFESYEKDSDMLLSRLTSSASTTPTST